MATIKDIAKYTKLALSTVSKYINGGTVRDANRKKIEEAIAILGYRRNEAARSLKTNRSMTIGILIPNLKSHFDTTILSIVEEQLTAAGYSVVICGYQRREEMEAEKLRFLLQKRVDGLIVVPTGKTHGEMLEFIRDRRPVVLLDRPLSGVVCDTILVDNEKSSYDIVRKLMSLGHRRIGIMPGNEDIYTGRMRLKGYLSAHRDTRLPLDYNLVQPSEWDLDSGYAAAMNLMEKNEGVTALLVCGDDMGFGVLKAIQDRKVRIPDDLSLVCYDLFLLAEIFRPKISTIDQPLGEIGRLAAERLLHRLENGENENEPETFILPARYYSRESVVEHR